MNRAKRIREKTGSMKEGFIKSRLINYADKLAYKSLTMRQDENTGPMECDYAAVATYFYNCEEYKKALEYEEIAADMREKIYAKDSVSYRLGERTLARYLVCNGFYDRAISILESIVLSSTPNIYFKDADFQKRYRMDLSAELLIEAYREKGEIKKAREYRKVFEEQGLTKPVLSCKCKLNEYRFKPYIKYIPDKKPLDISNVEVIILPPMVEIIEEGAFENCGRIKYITIPNTLKRIEQNAFAGCDSLQDVYYNGTLEEWQHIQICTGNEIITNAELHIQLN